MGVQFLRDRPAQHNNGLTGLTASMFTGLTAAMHIYRLTASVFADRLNGGFTH